MGSEHPKLPVGTSLLRRLYAIQGKLAGEPPPPDLIVFQEGGIVPCGRELMGVLRLRAAPHGCVFHAAVALRHDASRHDFDNMAFRGTFCILK